VSTMYIFAAALGSTEKYYYGRRGYPVDPQQDLYWYSSKIVKQAMRCFGGRLLHQEDPHHLCRRNGRTSQVYACFRLAKIYNLSF
jgi:hypothetical protein